ncbi:MAG: type III-A CRISPR-associated RAMP protein Csm4 [Chloroherpetonaceae bacterium]|nr:type III-A CRISPR-associated RAMP protein Csm4 [Chthonomonadaceae bacterium]MDW8209107.1 type III-A CRISPR-associated RAMP protein Csm4 [Chloroherpetonaceae bacterium]
MATLLTLIARGPWHLGKRGVGMEEVEVVLNADTLFSALCHAWLALYGSLSDLLRGFEEGDPPFLISSGFPYDGRTRVWYPPAPLARPSLPEGVEPKKIKKARFLPFDLWDRMRRGEQPDLSGFDTAEGFLMPVSHGDRKAQCHVPCRVEPVPHVALDRVSSRSNLYFTGQLFFQPECGFGVLIEFRRDEWRDRVLRALEWLGETGIGGERTSGCGIFCVREETIALEPVESAYRILLSPYNPRDVSELAAWDLERSHYQFLVRRGYADVPGDRDPRRRSLRMFAEGSVLRLAEGPRVACGRLINLAPEGFTRHPIYRYGYAFAVEWKGTGQ